MKAYCVLRNKTTNGQKSESLRCPPDQEIYMQVLVWLDLYIRRSLKLVSRTKTSYRGKGIRKPECFKDKTQNKQKNNKTPTILTLTLHMLYKTVCILFTLQNI